jgi:hypothetical protein
MAMFLVHPGDKPPLALRILTPILKRLAARGLQLRIARRRPVLLRPILRSLGF